MTTPFSQLLVQCRMAAGFKTAYEFYKKSGGGRVLRLSFVSYWRMEKGVLLPKPERLGLLLSCLRLPYPLPKARELALAYLRTLLGSERAYESLLGLISPKIPQEGAGLGETALRRALEAKNVQLSMDQFRAIVHDYGAYWSYVLLCNDQRAWKVPELARVLGTPKARLMSSLRLLAKHKVLALEGGKVSCPFAGKIARLPRRDATAKEDERKVRGYQERMIKSRGALTWNVYSLLRAYEPELSSFYPHLNQTVANSHVYALSGEPGEQKPGPTSLFLIEGSVYRLFSLDPSVGGPA